MYAIIVTGGKQYKVKPGQVLSIEKLEVEAGQSVKFDKVLLVSDGENVKIGAPFVDASVAAEVVEHGRGKKVTIIKFHRRKNYHRKQGHRQAFTSVKITGIAV